MNPKMTDEEFEAFYEELFEEFGDAPVNSPKAAPPAGKQRYQGHSAPAYGGSLGERKQVKTQAPRKQKGVKGLVICACLECLGIVGVVLWWLLRIL